MLDRRSSPPKVGAERKIQIYQLRSNMAWEARCNHCFIIAGRHWYTGARKYATVWRRVVTHAHTYHGVRLDA